MASMVNGYRLSPLSSHFLLPPLSGINRTLSILSKLFLACPSSLLLIARAPCSLSRVGFVAFP